MSDAFINCLQNSCFAGDDPSEASVKRLTKEQLELLTMLADTTKLRHVPNAMACLVSLEELGLVGPDFQLTEAGRRIVETQSEERPRRKLH